MYLSTYLPLYLVLNRRLTFFANVYHKISECQAGFRCGYSTIDNAFILQSIISKCLSKKRGKLYIAFVDFRTAYDSIERSKLWDVLKRNEVKGKLFSSFYSMYSQVKACVRLNGSMSNYMQCPRFEAGMYGITAIVLLFY